MRIAILDQSEPGWKAGEVFTCMMLASLDLADFGETEVVFLRRNPDIIPPAKIAVSDIPWSPTREEWEAIQRRERLDAIVPVRDFSLEHILVAQVGWIPDFQHVHLPEIFSAEELRARDRLFEEIARQCELVSFTCEAAAAEYRESHPAQAAKARVLRFPSLMWRENLSADPARVARKFHLPAKFALAFNQMWKHKNHLVLPPAAAEVLRKHPDFYLVVAGMPADYRDPQNRYLSAFLQACAECGVHDRIFLLGGISREDLVDLFRCAALIIQPSFHEGWSTSVEDAKALGRPLACSELPVLREQAPHAAFFDPRHPASLAGALGPLWSAVRPGPDLPNEARALAAARDDAQSYGESLLAVAEEAARIQRETLQTRMAAAKSALEGIFHPAAQGWWRIGSALALCARKPEAPPPLPESATLVESAGHYRMLEETRRALSLASRGLWFKLGRALRLVPR
ncbi:MAG TPA: glycosyltransferase [Chthoniobacterales bacterium]